ncbi:MAG: PQQ-binding-like beta-propeller repeat protein [Pirellulales bacterium]
MTVMLPAVVPVLVGPLQTLLALAPALLLGLGALFLTLFTPRGIRRLVAFFWHQKLLTVLLVLIGASVWTGYPWSRLLPSRGQQTTLAASSESWPLFRGGPARRGSSAAGPQGEPRSGGIVWENADDATVYSSPCIVGDQVVFSTATGIGPFSPAGRGAIVSVDAQSGQLQWRYAPADFRATFCSPVVAEGRVICGEGLHLVQDARVTCLDVRTGEKIWEFRTRSHVEATPCVAEGRVYVGAGDDGFYCLSLREQDGTAPRVLWHRSGQDFPDCESSPVVHAGTVYFGLGQGGQAICALDAVTGETRWKTTTPYPVFAPPTLVESAVGGPAQLAVTMGNGNFIQSAADLLEARMEELQEAQAPPAELDEARRTLGPAGEVWLLDLATGEPQARFVAGDTLLGGVAWSGDALVGGSRDGRVYRLSTRGAILAQWDAREPIVTAPAVGTEQVYVVTASGRLQALARDTLTPRWDMQLGESGNFLSSPVLAHGRIYVGTPLNGLRCVGSDGLPEPPCWTHGEQGGRADDHPLPTTPAIAWIETAPEKSVTRVWTPVPADRHVVAVRQEGDETRLAVFDEAAGGNDAAAVRPIAEFRHPLPVVLPPALLGDRVLLAMGPDAERRYELLAIELPAATVAWKWTARELPPRVVVAERQNVVVSDGVTLCSLDPADGRVRYERQWSSASSDDPVDLHLADDLLVVLRGSQGWLLDALTGAELGAAIEVPAEARARVARIGERVEFLGPRGLVAWNLLTQQVESRGGWEAQGTPWSGAGWLAVPSDEQTLLVGDAEEGVPRQQIAEVTAKLPPLFLRDQLIVIRPAGLALYQPTDESLEEWLVWRDDAERPATPLMTVGGHVYYQTAAGRLVCVAESAP